MAPVAMVFPSRATASFPPDRCSAMIPEPMTVANRKKEPRPSAAIRRPSGSSANDVLRLGGLSNLLQFPLQCQLVEALKGKREEQPYPPLQGAVGVDESSLLMFSRSASESRRPVSGIGSMRRMII